MRRIPELLGVIMLVALSLPARASSPAATALAAGDWPMMFSTPGNTMANPYETGITTKTVSRLKQRWVMSVDMGPPVVAGNVGYAACRLKPVVWGVCAFGTATGRQRWFAAISPKDTDYFPGVAVVGTRVVYAQDRTVVALDAATGKRLWTHTLHYPLSNLIGNLVVDGNRIVLMTTPSFQEMGTVVTLDVATGHTVWTHPGLGIPPSVPGLAVAKGLVVVPSQNRAPGIFTLIALDEKTGGLRWTYPGKLSVGSAIPVIDQGSVFVEGANKHLLAIDAATGTLRWSSARMLRLSRVVAAANGLVYAAVVHDIVAMNERTGAMMWQTPVGGDGIYLVSVGGDVLWGGVGGVGLTAMNARTGVILRKMAIFPLGAEISHGQLYDADLHGNLAAYYVPDKSEG